MKKTKTSRGFRVFTFKDSFNGDCSLQKSSNAECDQIWLGLDDREIKKHHVTGESLGMRMLIDRKLAAKLAIKLASFSETGEI